MSNLITEQLTAAGQEIEHSSFAIVDHEAEHHDYFADQWQIVRRIIHATADFEFNGLTQFHRHACAAGIEAMLNGRMILVDVEMIRVGLAKSRLAHFGISTEQFIADDDVIAEARAAGTTRAVQAMRKAHRLGLLNNSILAIGNAPTALLEVIRLIRNEGQKPALIIGMPVGFVAAAESKELLSTLTDIPWIITKGRKGGSTLVVAALHALLALTEQQQKEQASDN